MNIVIYGAGGHAKAVIDTIEQAGQHRIVGLLDNNKPVGTSVYGYEVLGSDDYLISGRQSIDAGIVAVGDNWIRARIVSAILAEWPNFNFISAVHPAASIARGVVIGEGTVIMAGAVVNSDAVIGSHSILYTNSSVDHDSRIGSYVTLAPKAATGGQVRVGDYSTLSIGCNIIHSIAIGEHTVIGAGATVLTNINSYTVAYGCPAREIRGRVAGERYL